MTRAAPHRRSSRPEIHTTRYGPQCECSYHTSPGVHRQRARRAQHRIPPFPCPESQCLSSPLIPREPLIGAVRMGGSETVTRQLHLRPLATHAAKCKQPLIAAIGCSRSSGPPGRQFLYVKGYDRRSLWYNAPPFLNPCFALG